MDQPSISEENDARPLVATEQETATGAEYSELDAKAAAEKENAGLLEPETATSKADKRKAVAAAKQSAKPRSQKKKTSDPPTPPPSTSTVPATQQKKLSNVFSLRSGPGATDKSQQSQPPANKRGHLTIQDQDGNEVLNLVEQEDAPAGNGSDDVTPNASQNALLQQSQQAAAQQKKAQGDTEASRSTAQPNLFDTDLSAIPPEAAKQNAATKTLQRSSQSKDAHDSQPSTSAAAALTTAQNPSDGRGKATGPAMRSASDAAEYNRLYYSDTPAGPSRKLSSTTLHPPATQRRQAASSSFQIHEESAQWDEGDLIAAVGEDINADNLERFLAQNETLPPNAWRWLRQQAELNIQLQAEELEAIQQRRTMRRSRIEAEQSTAQEEAEAESMRTGLQCMIQVMRTQQQAMRRMDQTAMSNMASVSQQAPGASSSQNGATAQARNGSKRRQPSQHSAPYGSQEAMLSRGLDQPRHQHAFRGGGGSAGESTAARPPQCHSRRE